MKMPSLIRTVTQAVRFRRARVQVAALPYRFGEDGAVEVLLVTTRGGGRWMVPKGWPMAGKSHAEAAAQEAYEEAGVRGSADATALGRFRHTKQRFPSPSVTVSVATFPMLVERELAQWPERGQRSRCWFSADEAARQVRSPELSRLISSFAGSARGTRLRTD